jgi:site-specific recombinase
MGLPLFIDGVVASINYALSFVLIHLLHGTLATKQPALTAAAMAHQLNAPRARGRLRGFVDEVANLVRSQVAAIMGNLLLVVPAALVLQAILLLLGFGHLPDLATPATISSRCPCGARRRSTRRSPACCCGCRR